MEDSAEFSARHAPHVSVDRSAIIDAAAILVENIIDKSVETIALRDTEMDVKEHSKKEKRKRKRGRVRRNKNDSVQSKGCDKSFNVKDTGEGNRLIVDEVGRKVDGNLGLKVEFNDGSIDNEDFGPLVDKLGENIGCSVGRGGILNVLDEYTCPKMGFEDSSIEDTDLCLLVNKIEGYASCGEFQDKIETSFDTKLGLNTESSKKCSVVMENICSVVNQGKFGVSSDPISSLDVDSKSSTGTGLGKELEAGPEPGRRKDFVTKPKFTQRSWLDDDNGEDDDGSDDDLLMVSQNIGFKEEIKTTDNEAAPILGGRFFAPCKNTIEPRKLESSTTDTHAMNANIDASNEKVEKKNCFDRRINEKCQNLTPDKNVDDKFMAKVVAKTVVNCATEKLSKCNERIVGKQLLKNNFASAIDKNVAVSSGAVSKSLPSNLQDHTTLQLNAYKNRFTGCSTMQNFEQCDMNNTIVVKNDVNVKIGTNVNNLNVDMTKLDKIKRSRRKTEPFDFELQSDGVLIKHINPVVEKLVEKPIVYSNSFSNTDKTRNLFSGFISDSGVFVPTSNMDKRSSRDSLDRIFDEECSDEDSLDDYEQDYDDGEGSDSENESSDCRSDSEDEALPPEPQLGNVEYKLKLVNPTKQRFEHLVTQMKWRLREGRGEALYEIGVRDCGRVRGLSSRDLRASLRTLRRMAARLGAGCALLTRGRVPGNPKRERAEVLVRKIPDDQHNIEVRVAVMGSNDAGKSTLVGVLTQGELDNGRGRARLNMFRHLHEVRTGRTSSVSHEILGFDPQGHPINYAYSELMTSEEIAERSSKLVSFIDLAGHRKYLKTTVQGLTGYSPHYAMLVVSATAGINQMTLEHLALVTALDLPFFIAVTKTDSTPPDKVIESLRQALNTIGCRKVPLPVLTQDDVILAASNALSRVAVPVFPVSSVSGCGLDRLGWFLFLAPPAMATCERDRLEQEPVEFQIDETFKVGGTSGPVVGGLLTKGVLTERTRLLIGPLDSGDFVPITVISLHRNKAPCRVVRAGQAASLGLSVRPPTLRQGMVILAIPDGYPGQTPKDDQKGKKDRSEPAKVQNRASQKNKTVSGGKESNLKIRDEDIAEIVDGIGAKGKNGRDVNLIKLVADGDDKLARLSPSSYAGRFVSPFANRAPSAACLPPAAVDLDVDSIVCDEDFDEEADEHQPAVSDIKDACGSDEDSGKDSAVDIDEGILKEDPNNPRGCYCFQATVSVLYHSTAIYPGFQATVHIGNIRQTAVIEGILAANSVLRAKDRAPVVFRFVRHPEYVKTGAHLLFREGLHTKGIGVVTQVFPHVSTDVRRVN